ncbi:unnamed protein product [Soboliphyme baturini]|uniref:Fungal_trans domain-containing protein n=1 Tax=Soboliphyme baturini TaxID=241478 RepID=A0A183J4A5_9BILA|nr:unnamed protein product [Soboliphyme baturini]
MVDNRLVQVLRQFENLCVNLTCLFEDTLQNLQNIVLDQHCDPSRPLDIMVAYAAYTFVQNSALAGSKPEWERRRVGDRDEFSLKTKRPALRAVFGCHTSLVVSWVIQSRADCWITEDLQCLRVFQAKFGNSEIVIAADSCPQCDLPESEQASEMHLPVNISIRLSPPDCQSTSGGYDSVDSTQSSMMSYEMFYDRPCSSEDYMSVAEHHKILASPLHLRKYEDLQTCLARIHKLLGLHLYNMVAKVNTWQEAIIHRAIDTAFCMARDQSITPRRLRYVSRRELEIYMQMLALLMRYSRISKELIDGALDTVNKRPVDDTVVLDDGACRSGRPS